MIVNVTLGNYMRKSHGSILALRSRWIRGKETVREGEALPLRSRQQSLRTTALLNRPAERANMTHVRDWRIGTATSVGAGHFDDP